MNRSGEEGGLIAPMPRPALSWQAGTPHARDIGDIYYNPEDGLAESRHVFAEGLDLITCWAGRDSYTLCELGFGTGLNFLLTWSLWEEAGRPCRLCYVGVEGFPLARADLERALGAFPVLAEKARSLLAQWPPPYPGFHRLVFAGGRIQLTLILADVQEALAALRAPVDGWYLDGFAPDRNPQMWDAAVFGRMAALSRPGARVASFSVAGRVRRGLEEAGFAVTRRPGFGRKRHALAAEFRGRPPAPAPRAQRFPELLAMPPPPADEPIAVIGAGLAGSLLARFLHDAGRDVFLVDPLAPCPTQPPVALAAPRPDLGTAPRARFEMLAGLFAQRFYGAMPDGAGTAVGGVIQLPAGGRSRHGAEAIVRHLGWEDDWLSLLPQADALWEGFAPRPALLWPRAGAIDTAAVLAALRAGLPLRQAGVSRIMRESTGWRMEDESGSVIACAATLVVAAGVATPELLAGWPLATRRIGGSLLHLEADAASLPPLPAIAGAFVIPRPSRREMPACAVLGAGHWPVADVPDDAFPRAAGPPEADSLRTTLTARLARLAPAAAAALAHAPLRGRFDGLRLATPDRLPLAGPLWAADETPRLKTLLAQDRRRFLAGLPHEPGLFVLTGFAGRGFTHAPLAARLLADLLLGDPPALPPALTAALHPARMLAR